MEQAGDPVALCTRLRPMLVGALSLYCGDRHVAEELAQEMFARVWDRRADVQEVTSPEAWAYRVAINLANSHYRRRQAERRALARMSPEDAAQPPDSADAVAVRQAVARLPRRQRSAVVLRYFADLSVAQTAQLMGCADGTVKSLTSQGLQALRGHLDVHDPREARHGA